MKGKQNALGTICPEETKAKLRTLNLGKRASEETRKKLSEAHMGNKNMLGKKHSAETRAKMSQQRRGKWTGAESPLWKGGRFLDKDGYLKVYRPSHPAADVRGYVLEHRLAMEEMLGRRLLPEEVVHHEDGNRTNNARENLNLFPTQKEHRNYHVKGDRP